MTFPPVLELWGGVECTHNRVGDRYFDQLDRSGHADRLEDLELIASLCVRSVRYPVLWERVASDEGYDWTWPDERLRGLRDLHVRPIVGLLHHGSGPRGTSLLDEDMPQRFAAYARVFAERYPWIDAYAPINEPLTTARFGGLYGIWHPHGTDVATFSRVLLLQCRAIGLAMREIRRVNPAAQLIQNEDVGKVFSTPALRAEADLQNERRWLTFDLLDGRVDRSHPLWSYLAASPDHVRLLQVLVDEPTPPDMMGIDYYLTSERMLDERVDRYPDRVAGGNDRHTYVDVEAVRVCDRLNGWAGAIRETWERYGRPIAVTEAHLACTREEQLRWLRDSWRTCSEFLASGVPVRALTVWSLFGAFDWDRLVTSEGTFYEPGAFDVSGAAPRATAVARMMRSLASDGTYEIPAMAGPGWWDRPDRFHYPPVHVQEASADADIRTADEPTSSRRRLLILAGDSDVGRAIGDACVRRGLSFTSIPEDQLRPPAADGRHDDGIDGMMDWLDPWAVVDASPLFDVDATEGGPTAARRRVARTLRWADACRRFGISDVVLSSDQVFAGRASRAYVETDLVRPHNIAGRLAADLERSLAARDHALVVRTGPLFGAVAASAGPNGLDSLLVRLMQGDAVRAAADRRASPTYLPHLIDVLLDLLIDGEAGIWHVANEGGASPADVADAVVRMMDLDPSIVRRTPGSALRGWAPRPASVVLGSTKGRLLPSLEDSLSTFVATWIARERTERAA